MLSSVVANSFSAVVLSPDFTSSERVSGKAVATRVMRPRDGRCDSYCRMSGISGPAPNIWPMPLRSSTRSLFGVTPQSASTFDQRGVLGGRLAAADAQRRIQHEQRVAAAFHVRLDARRRPAADSRAADRRRPAPCNPSGLRPPPRPAPGRSPAACRRPGAARLEIDRRASCSCSRSSGCFISEIAGRRFVRRCCARRPRARSRRCARRSSATGSARR